MLRFANTIFLLHALLSPSLAPTVGAAEPETLASFTAGSGVSLAQTAAVAWAKDARLIYVENDGAVRADGTAERWGYLYWSKERTEGRAYSILGDEILTAETLAFDFEAPPLPEVWIDAGIALAAAEREAGQKFRDEASGTLRSMILVRGLLDLEEANAATWAVVYDSAVEASLWVVVDATSGKVVRTWRG